MKMKHFYFTFVSTPKAWAVSLCCICLSHFFSYFVVDSINTINGSMMVSNVYFSSFTFILSSENLLFVFYLIFRSNEFLFYKQTFRCLIAFQFEFTESYRSDQRSYQTMTPSKFVEISNIANRLLGLFSKMITIMAIEITVCLPFFAEDDL